MKHAFHKSYPGMGWWQTKGWCCWINRFLRSEKRLVHLGCFRTTYITEDATFDSGVQTFPCIIVSLKIGFTEMLYSSLWISIGDKESICTSSLINSLVSVSYLVDVEEGAGFCHIIFFSSKHICTGTIEVLKRFSSNLASGINFCLYCFCWAPSQPHLTISF